MAFHVAFESLIFLLPGSHMSDHSLPPTRTTLQWLEVGRSETPREASCLTRALSGATVPAPHCVLACALPNTCSSERMPDLLRLSCSPVT